MHSKKKQAKIKRLKDLYDLSNPEDLFTILPQEMELMEVMGITKNFDGIQKKAAVLEIILELAKVNNIEINKNLLSTFIDIIVDASNGKYALNKGKS